MIEVRAILDSGSQRSFILKDLATKIGYISVREKTVNHSLFDVISEKYKHQCYRRRLADFNESFRCNFVALDQTVICENIIPVSSESWLEHLHKMKINVTNLGEKSEPIHILIRADVLGRLVTGQWKSYLQD
ncbi:DUF1758 domain-containing protein [Caerostris extrusa]|uniref:DUF1758 domain-containing protein n=1 Tax=Caerostris extrusa TaxID=172846 RepID=A0AAV4RDB6_CAEEX|nr:DUF1758 domain-containing protein [Caerostris extrusa]